MQPIRAWATCTYTEQGRQEYSLTWPLIGQFSLNAALSLAENNEAKLDLGIVLH